MVKDENRTEGSRRNGFRMLMRKLRRDLTWNWTQFLAMALLCALGTCVFCGLDATWRLIDLSMDRYYSETELADLWMSSDSFSLADVRNIIHIDGVKNAQARLTGSFDVKDLDDDTVLVTHAVDNKFEINIPLVKEGSMLELSDVRGCLVDERFVAANALSIGDPIRLDVYGTEYTFFIRGTIQASEHVSITRSVEADPKHYSFLYISHRAIPGLNYTDVLVQLTKGADAQAVEAELESMFPEAVVENRQTYESTQGVMEESQIYQDMTWVFPLIMFAVAVMISMTTLRRMIEKQRVQMGTLKALGYTDSKVRKHYLLYALIPSLLGAITGMLIGHMVLPNILWETHQDYSNYPAKVYPQISASAWIMAVLLVVVNLLICLRTYNKAAKEAGAALLRPKPPIAGNRVLLERIPALWNRMTTNGRMIVRNLMRNKLRTIMSTVGIFCCCMMILCTLGLMDSIEYFITNHYFGTLEYDVKVTLKGDATLPSYRNRLEAETVDGTMSLIVSVHANDMKRSLPLFVVNDDQSTRNLGMGTTFVRLPDKGVALSQKTAEVLGLKVGDTIKTWLPGNDKPIEMTLAMLADTNFELGLYISEHEWDSYRKYSFTPDTLLIRGMTERDYHELDSMNDVTSFKYPEDECAETMKNMDSVRSVFVIMSAVALGLAFTICYNMGLMNFAERVRDFATFKVLGYHHWEICKMVYLENGVTSLLGIALGVWPGLKLTKIVLKFAEPETVVYAPYVQQVSVVLACVITFAFSLFISWLLTQKIKRIDMVEALKGIE